MQFTLHDIIKQSSFPVYGLEVEGQDYNVFLSSIGQSSQSNNGKYPRPTSVFLGFLEKENPATCINIYSHNGFDEKARESARQILQPLSPEQIRFDMRTLQTFGFQAKQKELGTPEIVQKRTEIGEEKFSTTIHYWKLSPQPAWFHLVGDKSILFGETLGISLELIEQLFQRLTVINDRLDLIQRYQLELDKYKQQLFGN
jgi:hypothetical protein